MASTLLLDTLAWDLAVDAAGNIAVATEPYSLAQDAASAIRLFKGELYYDTSQGIPYFNQILGQAPPISLIKSYFVNAALTVPGVVKARCFITSWTDRVITGQVQVEDANGNVSAAGF
ncbi:hypothetical protein BFS86_19875 [Shewanella algae]|jgi:hypothetical protein|nr:hypothetical protein BFS86_19875 [Shewanella algae]DAQ47179.1 MAG TPA: Protein of unknown function (DUF2634) [Caudoviricetes sp.]DAU40309.1 MAG TPA: Protein of unknown function (DUF2634) [Caudoviricetes sp.]